MISQEEILFSQEVLRRIVRQKFNVCFIGETETNKELFKYFLSANLCLFNDEKIYFKGKMYRDIVSKLEKISSLILLKYQEISSLDELPQGTYIFSGGEHILENEAKFVIYDTSNLTRYFLKDYNALIKFDENIHEIVKTVLDSKSKDIKDFHILLPIDHNLINDYSFHYIFSDVLYLYVEKYLKTTYQKNEFTQMIKEILSLRGEELYLYIFNNYLNESPFAFLSDIEHQRWMIRTLLYDADDIYKRKRHLFVSFKDLYLSLTKISKEPIDYYQDDILIYDFLDVIAAGVVYLKSDNLI